MFKLIVCLFTFLSLSAAYRILVLFPIQGRSHSILGEGFVRLLLEDGHEVTYITPFPMKNPHKNLTQIDSSDKNYDSSHTLNFADIISKEITLDGSKVFKFMLDFTQSTLEKPEVQAMMKNPKEHFDLVILEWMFSEVGVGLSAVFECPYIWAAPMEASWMTQQLIDERPSPAYSVDFMAANLPPYGFIDRAKALVFRIVGLYFKNYNGYSEDKAAYQKVFGPVFEAKGKPLPNYDDVLYNVSLMFGNSHVSISQAISLPQNYKPIGGYHIDPDVKPLPENLQKLMDNAKEGVIYFSMGSNLKSKDLPDKIKKDLLEVFGSLKQTVIWKFEEKLPGAPKNVHIVQWAPQHAILAHPNCRLFVTHGGLLSTTEAVYFGVPTIGMPVFGDQFINVARAVAMGYAKSITWSYDIGKELKEAINEILNDPKYTQKVKELSYLFHDRPVHPTKEITHWVRHVIRTRGARHLRSPALTTPCYQKMYLDLLALVVFVLLVILKIVKSVCCGKKKEKKEKKN